MPRKKVDLIVFPEEQETQMDMGPFQETENQAAPDPSVSEEHLSSPVTQDADSEEMDADVPDFTGEEIEPEPGQETELGENLVYTQAVGTEPDIYPDSPEDADPPPEDEDDPSAYGELSTPLDVEQSLEDELAALEAEAANTDSPGDNSILLDSPASEQPEQELEVSGQTNESPPTAPKKPPPAKRKKAVAKGDSSAEDSKPEDIPGTQQAAEESGAPDETPRRKPPKRKESVKPETDKAAARSQASFYQTNFNLLDRDLTDEERREWNDIYASFRSRSILTGIVAGLDQNELPVPGENGKTEIRIINSLVVIAYRVKILIPESAVWMKGEERGAFLLRGMIGSKVDYVVTNVDREGEVALGSRTLALVKRRRAFISGRSGQPGDIVPCSVMVVGTRRCLLHCGGYDVTMRATDMSYTSMLDMRTMYRPGQELKARIIDHKPAESRLKLSVKEASRNPFDGAERRHPVGTRRQAVISGKYGGGVFCTLQDGTLCMCLYSNIHNDSDFLLGDNVIVHITQFDYTNRHIYGRIVSKW